MKKSLLFSFAILFFIFINIQPASAVTCYTNPLYPSTAFDVIRTCTSNSDCTNTEHCATFGGCGGWAMAWVYSPCKPLDCVGCQIADTVGNTHTCVDQTRPPATPNCCSYACFEGGSGYSASLYDQTCYGLTNIDNDVNNCGSCGNKCTNGKVCTSGSCACPDGKTWSSELNSCIVTSASCTFCIDGATTVLVNDCNAARHKCLDMGGGNCQLTPIIDTSCPVCTAPTPYWCASPNTPSNTCVQSSANCAVPTVGTCASMAREDCQYDETHGGLCKYCSNIKSCIEGTTCPIADNCNTQTNKTACDAQSGDSFNFDCGWCPNSYSGGTSANGGTCMKAENLAASCGGCFVTESYDLGYQYQYCSGLCPSYYPKSIYYGGWCDPVRSYCDAGSTSCDCLGNKFNTTKSGDNIVNCGECNINTEGKNCGGTAVTGKETNCNDGLDNNRNCLIDCADPDCATQSPCTASTFTIAAENIVYGKY